MNMKTETIIKLTEHRLGRVLLHLKCVVRDHKWSWHLDGLRRELFGRYPCAHFVERQLLLWF